MQRGLRTSWVSSGPAARDSIFAAPAQDEQKGDDMALFLVVHALDSRKPEAFVAAWGADAGSRIRCLKHWVSGNAIALLVEAPNEARLRAHDPDATEVTELFAPARRWMSYETIDLGQ